MNGKSKLYVDAGFCWGSGEAVSRILGLGRRTLSRRQTLGIQHVPHGVGLGGGVGLQSIVMNLNRVLR